MISQILIVDDQESIRHFISKALTDEGYVVNTAAEGKEALKAVERRSRRIWCSSISGFRTSMAWMSSRRSSPPGRR